MLTMKFLISGKHRRERRLDLRAFTLVEIQVSMAVIMLVIGGVISSHVFGLKLNESTRCRLSASDAARNAIGRLVVDVRSAKMIQVENGTCAAFTPVADGSTQQGSAIRIYPTTNTNSFAPSRSSSSRSTVSTSLNVCVISSRRILLARHESPRILPSA